MKRSPLKPKPNRNSIPADSRKVVRERSNDQCEFVNEEKVRCKLMATQMHHIEKRRSRNHSPENLIHLCMWCHEDIHANPAWSYDHGYMKRMS